MLKISCSNLFRYMVCPSALNHEQGDIPRELSKEAKEGIDKHNKMQSYIEGEFQEVFDAVIDLENEFKKIEPDFSYEQCVCEEKFYFNSGDLLRTDGDDFKFQLVGKPDLVYVSVKTRCIYIIDYKFGYQYVSENYNYQLLGYAYLIKKEFGERVDGFEIKAGIFQNNFLRLTTISNEELDNFQRELLDVVVRSRFKAYVPDSVACKWCSFREKCPSLLAHVDDATTEIVDACLHEMSESDIFNFRKFVILNKKLIGLVLDDVESYFKKSLQNGAIYDFCTLKSSGSLQIWDDSLNDDEISKKLSELSGRDESVFYEKKLKSPTQIKKIIGMLPEELIVVKEKSKSLKIIEGGNESVDVTF